MLLKRIAVALMMAATLMTAVPATWAGSPAAGGDAALPPVVTDASEPAGSWALVSFGMRQKRVGFWYEVFVLIHVSTACQFIGLGVSLVNPVAGFIAGIGCASSIGA